jgi:hypothetical protein
MVAAEGNTEEREAQAMAEEAKREAEVRMWGALWACEGEEALVRAMVRHRRARAVRLEEVWARAAVLEAASEVTQGAVRHAPGQSAAVWVVEVARTSQLALRRLAEGVDVRAGARVALREGELVYADEAGEQRVEVVEVGGIRCGAEEIVVCGWTRDLEHLRVVCEDATSMQTVALGLLAARGASCLAMERGVVTPRRSIACDDWPALRRAAEVAVVAELVRQSQPGSERRGVGAGVQVVERWLADNVDEAGSGLSELVRRDLLHLGASASDASALLFALAGICSAEPSKPRRRTRWTRQRSE